MRILFVNKFLFRKGGSETYLFDVADALKDRGHEVGFFSMQDERNIPCEQSKYFVSNSDYSGQASLFKQAREAATLVYSPEAKRKFDALLNDFRPDVVHLNLVHRQITLSILDASYLKRNEVPVVYTAHDFIPVCPNCTFLDSSGNVCEACLNGQFRHCFQKKCVKNSAAKSFLAVAEARFLRLHGSYQKIERYIAPSEFMRSQLVRGGFPAEDVVVMRNFLPHRRVESLSLKPSEKGTYFLFFGRLSQEKGVDILVEAFADAAKELPEEWRLRIVGTGPSESNLKRWAVEMGIADRVDFLGFRSGEDLDSLIRAAAWTVFPSIWYENMPYSVVESLAAGVPVVGSSLGGVPELVKDGEAGLICEAGDAQSLAKALVRAVRTPPADYKRMAASGRTFVQDTCSQEKYMQDLTSLYEELISAKKGN